MVKKFVKLFNEYNKKYGYEITYLESKLSRETAPLANGFDVVCIFVNDVVDNITLQDLIDWQNEKNGQYVI